MITMQQQQLFAELFPIEKSQQQQQLHAYHLQAGDSDGSKLGGKLAYRLRQVLPGHWVWAGGLLLTDTPPNPVKLLMIVDDIIKEHTGTFGKLQGVEPLVNWQPAPEILADFMVRGPLERLNEPMREALAKTSFRLRNARVEREHRIRAWVVNGEPAVSFSIVSHLIHDTDLAAYAATLEKPADVVGLRVADRHSTMQGDVVKVVGALNDHRERLLGLSQREETRALLRNAPDSELVVRVASGRNEYDYAASALNVFVGLDDTRRFEVNADHAEKALRLKPAVRAQLVKVIADIAKAEKLIANAYSTQNAPEPFTVSAYDAEIVFGKNRTRPFSVERMPADFETYGAYWQRERFNDAPVRVAIINTMSDTVDDFMEAITRLIAAKYGFTLEVVRERKVRVISQSNLESAVRVLQKENIDLILAFFENEDEDDDDENDSDLFIKSQTIGRGLPCLVIHESTLNKPEAMANLVMGIFARAGNVPYLFDEPLPYADYVVGLDLIRERKKDGDTMTGVARVYRSDGALLGYLVAKAPVARGEAIPDVLLRALFPGEWLAGQRVLIHNDGALRRDVLDAMVDWAGELGATFMPVEVMRRGVPRLYAFEPGKINRPPVGTAFRLNDREAFLVTSAAPEDATPQPVHIRTSAQLPIEQALHSIMMFTLLHYGTLKTPKLPVTIHHAEYIRASVLRGVMPDTTEGDVPFWL